MTIGMRKLLKIPHDKHVLLKQRIDNNLIPKAAEMNMREMLETVTLNPPISKQSDMLQMDEMRAQKQKSYVGKMGMSKSMRRTYMKLLKKGKVKIPDEYAGPSPTERLVKTYIKKYTDKQVSSIEDVKKDDASDLQNQEEKKHELLLGRYLNNSSSKNTFKFEANPELLKSKSIVLSNAYEFALKQLEYQSCNPKISEDESYKAVEELLIREDKEERVRSREVTDTVVQEQQKKMDGSTEKEDQMNTSNPKKDSSTKTIPSILHKKPRIALQLSAWGDRLRQVSYQQWTIGAITALDHWIAVNVLEVSEKNWERMLAGEEDVGTSRIRDLLVIRGALFPETLQDDPQQYPSTTTDEEEEVSMQSINQILQDLSNTNTSVDDEDDVGTNTPFSFDDDDEDMLLSDSAKREDLKQQLTQEIQVYRAQHLKTPYHSWSEDEKDKFDTFFEDYISFFVMPHERTHLDIEETKEKLLNMVPNNKEDNEEFWNSLQDETTIEVFLDELLQKKKKSTKDSESNGSAMNEFMNLPYQEQKARLMTLSTLRPLYDEYGPEQNYDKFFESNKEILLKSVPMETLTEDAQGHVTSEHTSILDDDKDGKYKLSMEQYGDDDTYEKKRQMLEVWRLYKLKRANVEEEMFKKGELGLKYLEKDEDE